VYDAPDIAQQHVIVARQRLKSFDKVGHGG